MKLYELADGSGRRFSPFCWRIRMALQLKGMQAEAMPVGFTQIPGICGGTGKSVPTLELQGGDIIADSFAIARRLDRLQPARPLFRGPGAEGHCRLIEGWANTSVAAGVRGMIIADIWAAQSPVDKTYFRNSRESRFGQTLEAMQDGREDRVQAFNRDTLAPLTHALAHADWLGGDAPDYADCIVFGSLIWGYIVSGFKVLEDGPAKAWLERCCELLRDEPEIAAVRL